MKRVLILLSTYNGEKFLSAQLDSLYAQRDVEIEILVRDDGSKDKTLNILQSYRDQKGKMHLIQGKNIGASASFMEVAHIAITEMPEYDYYCFCDQDDVWLPDKLITAIQQLDDIPQSNKIYIGRAAYVDANYKEMGEAPKFAYFDYTTSIYRNPALGCTMVFDRQLLEYFHMAYPNWTQIHNLHDAWMFKCATYLDSTIIADNNIHIKYRQHGNNVTMAKSSTLKRHYNALKRRYKDKGAYKNNTKYFLDIYKPFIKDRVKADFLRTFIDYDTTLQATFRFLHKQSWKSEKLGDKILWHIMIWLRWV